MHVSVTLRVSSVIKWTFRQMTGENKLLFLLKGGLWFFGSLKEDGFVDFILDKFAESCGTNNLFTCLLKL